MSRPIRFPAAARLLQTALDRQQITFTGLGRLMKPDSANPASVAWTIVKGQTKPHKRMAEQLCEILDIKPEDLAATYEAISDDPPPPRQSIVAQLMELPAPPPSRVAPAKPTFSFNVLSDGRAQIKLDVELSAKDGMALAQTLMGLGILFASE